MQNEINLYSEHRVGLEDTRIWFTQIFLTPISPDPEPKIGSRAQTHFDCNLSHQLHLLPFIQVGPRSFRSQNSGTTVISPNIKSIS